jgi:AraC family transcriptional activator of pobA
MKKEIQNPYIINSISDLHRMLELPKPQHPLVSVIDMTNIKCHFDDDIKSVIYNFYSICTKKDFDGKLKYGQNYYDFDDGIMTFFAPGQVISTETSSDTELKGMWLVVHPDYIRNYALGKKIKEYTFFSYAVNEALHLSDKEETMVNTIMQNIEHEYHSNIDGFSQDVIISQIELVLNYSNRFYNRQFITRKNANSDLLIKLEDVLDGYFNSEEANAGLPTVKFVADKLNVSPHYLSDMLRSLTGQNAQQHIHTKLIDKAKEILTTTPLTVSEIAYRLGFEYPQSFSKLFKIKTNVSPLEYRKLFN